MMKTLWEQDDDADDVSKTTDTLAEQEAIDKEKKELLGHVTGHQVDTVKQQVAWILNQYLDARDSDVELQIRYWQNFERNKFNGYSLTLDEYRRMAQLTTLVRTRQIIQNRYGLFKASPAVQKHRGTLQESEREKIIADQASTAPLIEVYIDESGKTEPTLFVGSMWTREGPGLIHLAKSITSITTNHKIKDEFHFRVMRAEDAQAYSELLRNLMLNSANLSFKLIHTQKAGISNVQVALQSMAYHLVSRGIEHEIAKGRLSLPIRINVWKDAEDKGSDSLFLAQLRQTLETVGRTRYSGQLIVNELDAIPSEASRFIQMADLFVGSMRRAFSAHSSGRSLNGDGSSHKDIFAATFVKALRIDPETLTVELNQDMVHLMQL